MDQFIELDGRRITSIIGIVGKNSPSSPPNYADEAWVIMVWGMKNPKMLDEISPKNRGENVPVGHYRSPFIDDSTGDISSEDPNEFFVDLFQKLQIPHHQGKLIQRAKLSDANGKHMMLCTIFESTGSELFLANEIIPPP